MEIEKVGVVGCGLMGHGIAQICARPAGMSSSARSTRGARQGHRQDREAARPRGRQGQARAGRRRRGPRPAHADRLRGPRRLRPRDRGDHRGPRGKLELWGGAGLDRQGRRRFATNTSSLSVADQAAATSRPARFLGLHFFNPAQVMPLLEVVRADGTDDDDLELGLDLGEQAGQDDRRRPRQPRLHRQPAAGPLHARRDPRPRAGRGVDRGHRPRDDGGSEPPDGPARRSSDFVGLDTLASIASVMHEAYGEDRFAAPETLAKLVDAGHFGRKSGRGFYDYSGDKPVAVEPGRVAAESGQPAPSRGFRPAEGAAMDGTRLREYATPTSHSPSRVRPREVDRFLVRGGGLAGTGGGDDARADLGQRRARAGRQERIADTLTEAHASRPGRPSRTPRRGREQLFDANVTPSGRAIRGRQAFGRHPRRGRRVCAQDPWRGRRLRERARRGPPDADNAEERGRAEKQAERIVAEASGARRHRGEISDLEQGASGLDDIERLSSGIVGPQASIAREGRRGRERRSRDREPISPARTRTPRPRDHDRVSDADRGPEGDRDGTEFEAALAAAPWAGPERHHAEDRRTGQARGPRADERLVDQRRSPRRHCSPTGTRRASAPTGSSPAWRSSAAEGRPDGQRPDGQGRFLGPENGREDPPHPGARDEPGVADGLPGRFGRGADHRQVKMFPGGR